MKNSYSKLLNKEKFIDMGEGLQYKVKRNKKLDNLNYARVGKSKSTVVQMEYIIQE